MESEKVKVIHFSRNYGHEAAMIAGIDYSTGDGVICMDADLQHPVECIPQILDAFHQGYEVVSMVRMSNKSAGLFKNITSKLFYKIFKWNFRNTFLRRMLLIFLQLQKDRRKC